MTNRIQKHAKDKATVTMPAPWLNEDSEALFKVILSLQNLNEAQRFFRDLLTEREIREFARRWKVARMLAKKVKYDDIEDATSMSSTTIARIHQWLGSGMGGYRLALNRLHHQTPTHSRRGLS